MTSEEKSKIQKIDDYRWRIPREGKMKTDGIIYADERMFNEIRKDQSLAQVANVAWLQALSAIPLPCRTPTGDTDFPLVEWLHSIWMMGSSLQEGWDMISTEA